MHVKFLRQMYNIECNVVVVSASSNSITLLWLSDYHHDHHQLNALRWRENSRDTPPWVVNIFVLLFGIMPRYLSSYQKGGVINIIRSSDMLGHDAAMSRPNQPKNYLKWIKDGQKTCQHFICSVKTSSQGSEML